MIDLLPKHIHPLKIRGKMIFFMVYGIITHLHFTSDTGGLESQHGDIIALLRSGRKIHHMGTHGPHHIA